MPALIAFGRRWQIGSDDFVFGGFLDLLIRVSILIAACIIYWHQDVHLDCPGGHYMRVYLLGNFVVLLLIIFINIALIQNSMSGYIMDQDSRKYVAPCLYIRLLLEIPEIGWNILGTVWAYAKIISCTEVPSAIISMKVLIWINWALVIIVIVSIALVFDPLGASYISPEELTYERFQTGVLHNKRSTLIWERRCRFIMCSCIGEDESSRGAFKELGKIMGLLFDDVDLVPSDLAAGLIILHLRNQASELFPNSVGVEKRRHLAELESLVTTNEPRPDDLFSKFETLATTPSNDVWNTPLRVCHFMKYALGSYGWPWFLMAHKHTGLCRLWENILCCGCCVSHPCSVEEDNCCFCHTSALKNTINVKDEDLIYASFHNQVYRTPFFVAIDHSTRSVVVSIRGTMSLRDTVTDLNAEAKPLGIHGLSEDFKAHSGMIFAAKNVHDRLEKLRVLQKAFGQYPEYNLVITGHSLGAGTASILSIMMKPRYPSVRCYAYSPPGGLLTLEAAKFCEDFIVSIIVGDDIVGRLSVPSFEKFKKKLQVAIRDCKAPKYRILVGGCWYLLVGGIPKSLICQDGLEAGRGSNTQLLTGPTEANYHTYVSLVEESQRLHREAVTQCPMYPPGKIMHVTQRPIFNSRPELMDGPKYEYKWADRTEFGEILVTPKMMMDHYPDNVFRALEDIANYDPSSFIA